MVLWRKRQENFKECNAIKHKSRKTLKRVLWLLLLYKIVVFPSCSDIQKNLVYMLYLEWYDAKYIKKSRSFQKQCVFPLFSKKKKKQLRFCRNCLISNVDQPGLEPGTSRLWVCCSNQLSYKSDAKCYGMTRIVPLLRLQIYKYFLNCAIFVRKNMRVDGVTSSWVDE